MMKAIQVKYLAPTNTKGSRWKAIAWPGLSVTLSYDHALTGAENARTAAYALSDKMCWKRPKGEGQLPNGDYVFTLGGE
jgi:hypothetical protein